MHPALIRNGAGENILFCACSSVPRHLPRDFFDKQKMLVSVVGLEESSLQNRIDNLNAPVAQLDRASAFQ